MDFTHPLFLLPALTFAAVLAFALWRRQKVRKLQEPRHD